VVQVHSPLREGPCILLVVDMGCNAGLGVVWAAGSRPMPDAGKIAGAGVQPKSQVQRVDVVDRRLHSIWEQMPVRFQIARGVATPVVSRLVHSPRPAIVQVEVAVASGIEPDAVERVSSLAYAPVGTVVESVSAAVGLAAECHP